MIIIKRLKNNSNLHFIQQCNFAEILSKTNFIKWYRRKFFLQYHNITLTASY